MKAVMLSMVTVMQVSNVGDQQIILLKKAEKKEVAELEIKLVFVTFC
jgi:hypothetical protein